MASSSFFLAGSAAYCILDAGDREAGSVALLEGDVYVNLASCRCLSSSAIWDCLRLSSSASRWAVIF